MTKQELLDEIELEITRLKIKKANGGETYGLLDDADEVKQVLECLAKAIALANTEGVSNE